MLLPNANEAYVPDAKLFDYLLAPSHPDGGPKAAFFDRAGYTAANVEILRAELLRIAREGIVTNTFEIDVGKKFVVEEYLRARTGRGIPLRTVWVIDQGTTAPRFVTAYPL